MTYVVNIAVQSPNYKRLLQDAVPYHRGLQTFLAEGAT